VGDESKTAEQRSAERAEQVPADVNLVRDKDGDSWYRLADGRWICRYGGFISDLDQLVHRHGPVTW
jgi:hypothetical protein